MPTANGTGTINVSITDPPSCAFPNGSLDHVWVTIRSVQAHISPTADDNTPGWQELAPQLNGTPMQIDLFGLANGCLLAMLGSNNALPAGTYQQIRLLLVANDSSGPLPASNACTNVGFNCVQLHSDGSFHELLLSSQANTGLKIPPGQVVGGPITVAPGQDVDLNIDFNACASILRQGNGEFRLKPVLTAGQVSTNRTGISGQVVDSVTGMPIAGAQVALEKQDKTGTDVTFEQVATDGTGSFNFCPLPAGATFDVVSVAIVGGVAYNATIAVGVPGGTDLGRIPLVAETGTAPANGPGTLQGFVTATNVTPPGSAGGAPSKIDAAVLALQTITLSGGGMRDVTIPAEDASAANVSVDSNATCPPKAPANINCAQYKLVEPASNPSVGTFSAGKITYGAPAGGGVLYKVRADAFVPMDGGTTDCTPSTMTTAKDSLGNPLKVTGGMTTTVAELDFGGCT